jgi:hypothetical protein
LATGFSRQELVGKEFSDYFTEPQQVRAAYQQAFQTGQVLDCLLLRRRDGHTAQRRLPTGSRLFAGGNFPPKTSLSA